MADSVWKNKSIAFNEINVNILFTTTISLQHELEPQSKYKSNFSLLIFPFKINNKIKFYCFGLKLLHSLYYIRGKKRNTTNAIALIRHLISDNFLPF